MIGKYEGGGLGGKCSLAGVGCWREVTLVGAKFC